MTKFIFIFDPINGRAIPDGLLDEELEKELVRIEYAKRIGCEDVEVVIGSSVFIERLRLAIVEDRIDHNDIAFKFNGEILQPNEFGNLKRWPKGFGTAGDIIHRIVKGQCEKRKRQRDESNVGNPSSDSST